MTGSVSYLAQFFYERLGCHFEERFAGSKTWEGLVYEMQLSVGGVVRRRSLDLMYNHVLTNYTSTADADGATSAASLTQSINRYGRREMQLSMQRTTLANAEYRRDLYLKENQWPSAYMVGVRSSGEAKLEIMVCGYIFTGNWRYVSTLDSSTVNLSDWIKSLITADCPYLRQGVIKANTYQVTKTLKTNKRIFDQLTSLVELGRSGYPAQLYVLNDRYVRYQTIETAPRYYMRDGKLSDTSGGRTEVAQWKVLPGVGRDLTYPSGRKEYSAWLLDARDFVISEVEASDTGVTLKTTLFEESELMAAQDKYEQQLYEEAGGGEGGGGGGGSGKKKKKKETPKPTTGSSGGGGSGYPFSSGPPIGSGGQTPQ